MDPQKQITSDVTKKHNLDNQKIFNHMIHYYKLVSQILKHEYYPRHLTNT